MKREKTRALSSSLASRRGRPFPAVEKTRATCQRMKNLSALSDAELLDSTRLHVQRTRVLDAELLLLLGEIDARKLYAEKAYSSMFTFCMGELGFSEDVAFNRLTCARLARDFPRVLDFVRDGRIHLTGLRLLEPVLTSDNLEEVLAAASGKSKRAIEELVVKLAPQPAVPPTIRKVPERAPVVVEAPALLPLTVEQAPVPEPLPVTLPAPVERKPTVKPLSEETYVVKFTASAALKAKLEKAQELLGHRVDAGDFVAVIDRALDLLIEDVLKERFGVGRKARSAAANAEQKEVASTRHIPDAMKREVYERDGGQCTFVSDDGRRCEERSGLEFEHIEGFARTEQHSVEGLTLHCRTHNQLAADRLYGREFMDAKRRSTRPGTGEQAALL
jgi:hypothetical protein